MKRTCIECEKCSLKISKSNYKKHFKSCNGEINYWSKRKLNLLVVNDSTECKFCKRISKNPNSNRNHQRLCKENPDKQSTFFETNNTDVVRIKKEIGNFHNQFSKAESLGLPKPKVRQETKNKISHFNKNRSDEFNKKMGEKISITVCKKIIDGTWHGKKYNGKKTIYKGITFDSSWEAKYAEWLDVNNIKWERCKTSFPYVYQNCKKNYIPDFYLPITEEYIEIKGIKTEKDDAKWNQFPKELKLTILMGKDLKQMGAL